MLEKDYFDAFTTRLHGFKNYTTLLSSRLSCLGVFRILLFSLEFAINLKDQLLINFNLKE